MATKTFTTMVGLENYIESACEIAVKNVAERMVEELQSYIREDFYNQYKPRFYTRTYQLLKSPKYNMLSSNSAEIFIDMDVIHYLIGDPQYDYNESDIVKLASLGYHGTTDIYRPGMFWEDFIDWCNKNVSQLLKSELKKQGLIIK